MGEISGDKYAFAGRLKRGGIDIEPISTHAFYIFSTVFKEGKSRCLANGYGFCVTKAALLAAALRVHGIPARVGYADVRNHMTSPRMRATMGTDVFAFHGYTDVWLDGRWVKATPAFNLTLCERAGTKPLEFDGETDSILQPFDLSGRRHMEYVQDRGTYADLPLAELIEVWDEIYPVTAEWKRGGLPQGDFEREVERPQ